LKAWVIEINDHPSLNINLCKEGAKGLEKTASGVDKYIKMKVVGDCIKFMNKHKKNARPDVDSYRSLQRILPCEEMDDFSIFSEVKTVFDKLTGKRG
jgi:hypothetical protein